MANYVVSIKTFDYSEARFAVFHSGSSTMYAPTFDRNEELLAHMFACEFAANHCDYSERAQNWLAATLRVFMGEMFPSYRDGKSRLLPDAWRAALPYAGCEHDASGPCLLCKKCGRCDESVDSRGVCQTCNFTTDDLVDWYNEGDSRLAVCQDAFHAWRNSMHGVRNEPL